MENCILVFTKYLEDEGVIDEQDLSTIEFAKRLREKTGWIIIGATITRKENIEHVSRELYSRGIDIVQIWVTKNTEKTDIYTSSIMMNRILERNRCGIIVMGERSSDTSFGSLAGYLAGISKINHLRYVKEVLDMTTDGIIVTTVLDEETKIKTEIPSIIVPIGEYYPPRPISMKEKIEARKKKPVIEEIELSNEPKAILVRMRKPDYKKRLSKKVESLDELVNLIIKNTGDEK